MTTQVGTHKSRALFEPIIIRQAIVDACGKLDPRHQIKNPVMFVVWAGSVLTTLLFLQAVVGSGGATAGFHSGLSRCGSGSPCCLLTLPRPWRKDGARRRRIPYDERVRNSLPRSSAQSNPQASSTRSGVGNSTGLARSASCQ